MGARASKSGEYRVRVVGPKGVCVLSALDRVELSINRRSREAALARWRAHAFGATCLVWKSLTAALMASSASMEQCSFTGGSFRCPAMSELVMADAARATHREERGKVRTGEDMGKRGRGGT